MTRRATRGVLLGDGIEMSDGAPPSKILRYAADVRTLALIGGWFALVALEFAFAPMSPWVVAPLVAVTCMGSFLGAVATWRRRS